MINWLEPIKYTRYCKERKKVKIKTRMETPNARKEELSAVHPQI